MDALTAFFISAVMILLNGAVLGLMHRDLPKELRPSALSWRVGTLLQAGGCILIAVQGSLPRGLTLIVAHGMLLLGVTGYWRALRQFYGFAESHWILLPFACGGACVFWLTAVEPSSSGRLLAVVVAWAAIVGGCIATLTSQRARDAARSRRVLTGVFISVLIVIVVSWAVFGTSNPLRDMIGDASWIKLLAPLIAAILPVVGTTAYLQLSSERIRRQWEHAASTDHLTGLPNRRTVAREGERHINAALRQSRPLSVAVLDLDHFKGINDRFGHEVGDAAINHAATQIAQACRVGDLFGRLGGEEFVVILTEVEGQHAIDASEHIRRTLEQKPFSVDGSSVSVTVSIGLASLVSTDVSLDDLLRRADRAMYRAKNKGRNRVEYQDEFARDTHVPPPLDRDAARDSEQMPPLSSVVSASAQFVPT